MFFLKRSLNWRRGSCWNLNWLYSSKRRKSQNCTIEGRRNNTHLVIVMSPYQTGTAWEAHPSLEVHPSLEAQEAQLAHPLHLAHLCFSLRLRLLLVVKIPEWVHLLKQSFFQKLNQNLVLHGISASLLLHACAIIAFLLENYCIWVTLTFGMCHALFHSTGHIIVVNITSSWYKGLSPW